MTGTPRTSLRVFVFAVLLVGLVGCSKCGADKSAESGADGGHAARAAPASTSCLQPHDQIASCEDTPVPFLGDLTTVRLCRLKPRDVPGETPEGATRAELRVGGKPAGCVKLEDVGSVGTICTGPQEASCMDRVSRDNLAHTERFWAPRNSKENLLVFFGEVLDSDLPSIEIVRIKGGKAKTVFHREPGRTEEKFVFSRLEDVDKDGVPELLGWERPAELEECQPYIPLAVFKLKGESFVRDDKLMEEWALRNSKAWHGPDPDDSIRECEDESPEPEQAPSVVRAPRPAAQ